MLLSVNDTDPSSFDRYFCCLAKFDLWKFHYEFWLRLLNVLFVDTIGWVYIYVTLLIALR